MINYFKSEKKENVKKLSSVFFWDSSKDDQTDQELFKPAIKKKFRPINEDSHSNICIHSEILDLPVIFKNTVVRSVVNLRPPKMSRKRSLGSVLSAAFAGEGADNLVLSCGYTSSEVSEVLFDRKKGTCQNFSNEKWRKQTGNNIGHFDQILIPPENDSWIVRSDQTIYIHQPDYEHKDISMIKYLVFNTTHNEADTNYSTTH